jgi:hypothetical protein
MLTCSNIAECWPFVAEHVYCLHPEGLNNPENEGTAVCIHLTTMHSVTAIKISTLSVSAI